VLCCLLVTLNAAVAAAEPPPPTAPAGSLAELPVRGLAAAIAEAGRIEVPAANPRELLSVEATQASRWTEGSYDVWHLTGGVTIRQGQTEAEANEAVVWIEQPPPVLVTSDEPTGPPLRTVLARLAGTVRVRTIADGEAAGTEAASLRDDRWAGRFWVIRDPQLTFDSIVPASGRPAVYEAPADLPAATPDGPRLVSTEQPEEVEEIAGGDAGVVPAQFAEFGTVAAPAAQPVVVGRRLRAFPRSSMPLAVQWFPSPAGGEWIAVITSGINLVIDGVDPAGPLDISADRMVIWTRSEAQPDLGGDAGQSADTPLELYMEGNVVFRQGQRVIEAVSMFYDVPRSSGVITGASVLTPVDSYAGLIRLRADVLRQVDRSRFVAERTGLTTSRMGVPTWEFRSRELTLTDEQVPVPGPFGMPMIDPVTRPSMTQYVLR